MKSKIQNFVETVESYVRTPFVHQGRQPGKGLDCVGVLVCAAHEAGLSDADFIAYGEEPDGTLLRHLEPHLSRVADATRQPGDVLVLRYAQEPTHVAIVTAVLPDGRLKVVHSLNREGVVMHHLDALWLRRIVGVYRFGEV